MEIDVKNVLVTGAAGFIGFHPVSYTHLTLPTTSP